METFIKIIFIILASSPILLLGVVIDIWEAGGVERWLDAKFRKKVIRNYFGDVYLYRWFLIRTKHFGLFVNKFVRSGEDRALHDHPWNFLVILRWNGVRQYRYWLRLS